MYWMCFANQIALNSGWSFTKVVRLLPILADSIIAVVVFLALIKLREEKNAWKAGLFYALNPVTIMVSAYHGQFDALPCLFILLAWFFLRFQPTRRPWVNFLFSSLSLGAAILSKSWPIFFLPLLIAKLTNWKMRLKYIGLVGAVPLAGLIAYSLLIGGDIFNPIRIAISYSHGTGIWGYTYLLRLGVQNDLFGSGVYAFIQEYGRWMTLLMLTIIMMKAVKTKDMDGILLIILSLYAFGHIFSIQYLAWIVPFAVLSQRLSWLRRYILAATPYMLLAYFTLILAMRIDNLIPWPEADMALIIPVGLVPWIISVAWFINQWMFAADRTSLEIREA
jgi:hypothetical protein